MCHIELGSRTLTTRMMNFIPRIPTLKMKFKVQKSKLEMFRYCGTKSFITKNFKTFLFQFKDIHNIPIM